MSRNHFPLKWRIFPIISIVFQTVLHMTFCEGDLLWCGDKREEALEAVNQRNVSAKFKLTTPLIENQSLVWAKWITLDNRLLDNIDKTSANRGRYNLTKGTGENTFDLFIAFTELSDSGKHVVKIHHGAQSLCTVALFNLTIAETKPICSNVIDQETQRVQMSCEWMQINLGDQVKLLAGDQVVYEYETPEMHIDGDFNLTNKLSVYVPLENLYDDPVVPSMCLISNKKRSVNQACTFLPMQNQPLRSVFECCTTAEADAVKFWYNTGSYLLPLILTDKFSFIHVGHLSFFCGVQDENNLVILHSIENLNLVEGIQYNISLSALGRTEGFDKSNENLRCENISFEATNIEKHTELYTLTTNTETVESTLSSEVNKVANTAPTWVWVILVLSIILCLATNAFNCYYIVFRKYQHHIGKEINYAMQMDSMVAIGDTGAQSEDMGNLELRALQGRRDSGLRGATALQDSIGEERHNQNQVRKAPISDLQGGPPSLHSQRQPGEPESSCFAHRPTNYTSNREDRKGAIKRITTGPDTNPDKHIIHDLASEPYPDTTYSSVDDVKGTS